MLSWWVCSCCWPKETSSDKIMSFMFFAWCYLKECIVSWTFSCLLLKLDKVKNSCYCHKLFMFRLLPKFFHICWNSIQLMCDNFWSRMWEVTFDLAYNSSYDNSFNNIWIWWGFMTTHCTPVNIHCILQTAQSLVLYHCIVIILTIFQETLEAIQRLSTCLDVQPSAFSYAGIKDKKAVTTQHVVVRGISPEQWVLFIYLIAQLGGWCVC